MRCCKPPFAAREKFSPEGFQRAIGKPFGRLRRGESSCETEKESKALFLANHKKSIFCGNFRFSARDGPPKVSKGRAESPLVASAEANAPKTRKKKVKLFSLPTTRNLFFMAIFALQQGKAPEGFQRAIGKPFGRLRRGESSCETEKRK